ncbi:hypothetical protein NXY11_20865 [Parabacteroides faecis]|nr:hypothetical protein [Parabacteroides faecis]MCS2890745.1 hypothetical protein [Parabacteroides faecis]UVQ45589.1 hypothetical protein NXY11_20865 [Parabacteroides faecis]
MPTDIDKNKISLFEESYAFSGNIFMLSDKVWDAGIVKEEQKSNLMLGI